MFGFGFPEFLMTDKQREWRDRQHREAVARRLSPLNLVEWTPDLKWIPELNLSANSYQAHVRHLFEVKPTDAVSPGQIPESSRVYSRDKQWFYCERIFPRGYILDTLCGRKRGTVMFDDDVVIPSLHEEARSWTNQPWMSLTPMEMFTLRAGTRFAKGHVVVAGLGLGHQLVEVSLRKQVRCITLVERSDSLVNFILPQLKRFLGHPVDAVIVGDARKVVPESCVADVALVDIFSGYGGNDFPKCPNVGKVWCWGSAG